MKKFEDVLLYKITRPIITVLFRFLYTPKIIGTENIPKDGRVVLAGNHTNNFDCLLLISATKRNIHFLAKNELWKGVKKIIFSNMGLIPVDRTKHDHSALENAYGYLNNNKVVGIFPEGTTEKNRGLLPFKIGAIKIAYETNSSIIPFVITGNYRLFSKNLKIEFLKPMKLKTDNLTNENDKLYNLIKSKLEE